MLSFRSFLEGFNVRPLIRTPSEAYAYAKEKGERIPELEELIATDTWYSYIYARDVIKGPWELIEPTLALDPRVSYDYARYVLKGPFSLGEPVIAKDTEISYRYAKDVIKGPFPLGEPAIARDPTFSGMYQLFLDSIDKE